MNLSTEETRARAWSRLARKTYTSGSDASLGYGTREERVQALNTPDDAAVKQPDENPLRGEQQSDVLDEGAIVKVPGAASLEAFLPGTRVKVHSLQLVGEVVASAPHGGTHRYHVKLLREGVFRGEEIITTHDDLQVRSQVAAKQSKARAGTSRAYIKAVSDVRGLRADVEHMVTRDLDLDALNTCITKASTLIETQELGKRAYRAVQMAQYALGSARNLYARGNPVEAQRAISMAYGYLDGAVGVGKSLPQLGI